MSLRYRRDRRDASPSRQSSNNNTYRNRSPESKYTERQPCEYGNNCYRKNPEHFKEYFHPHTFLNEIVENLKNLKTSNDEFSIGEKVIDPEFEIINDNNNYKLKEFIIYCITNFEEIVKNYDIQDLIFIFMQFDARNSSRTFEVCDEKQIDIIKLKFNDNNNNNNNNNNNIYNDLNAPGVDKKLQKITYNIECENFILINSSLVLVLLQDYQNKQLKYQEQKTPGGKRESYKRKSYKRESYKRESYKRKTYKKKNNKKKNKKNRSVKNRRI